MLIKFNSNEKQTIEVWSYLFDTARDWACLSDSNGKEIIEIKYLRFDDDEVCDVYQVTYKDKTTKEYLEDDEIYLSIEVEV
jgi:hypothetical protein